MQILWRFAQYLQIARGKADEAENQRTEYNFYVADERIEIVERLRGSPVDKIVSELMIYANAEWGGQLAKAEYLAIYRAQSNGTARMTTAPSRHDGLGVAQYAWSARRCGAMSIDQPTSVARVGRRAARPYIVPATSRFWRRCVSSRLPMTHTPNSSAIWNAMVPALDRAGERLGADATVLRETSSASTASLVMRVPSLHDVKAGDQVSSAISKVDPGN